MHAGRYVSVMSEEKKRELDRITNHQKVFSQVLHTNVNAADHYQTAGSMTEKTNAPDSSRSFPQYKICNRNPSFSRCRFNLLGDANSRLNLLNPNAAIRRWLTISVTDFIAQERSGQPVAPLIVALAQDGQNPRLAAEDSNQIIL